jgi:hypothetical protein
VKLGLYSLVKASGFVKDGNRDKHSADAWELPLMTRHDMV